MNLTLLRTSSRAQVRRKRAPLLRHAAQQQAELEAAAYERRRRVRIEFNFVRHKNANRRARAIRFFYYATVVAETVTVLPSETVATRPGAVVQRRNWTSPGPETD